MSKHTRRTKHALLVGIDAYPFFPPENQLNGCVHDSELMAEVLEKRFRFARRRMRSLHDSSATRADILEAMEDLLREVGEGDIVVFHYSGHGSQMLSSDPREGDGLDETLVPYDSGRRGHPNRDIRDKEIHDWILRLQRRTDAITLIFDSCHSGGAVRSLNERRVEPDLRPPGGGLEPPRTVRSAVPFAPAPSEDRGTSGWLPTNPRFVLIAASRDSESACELPAAEAGGIAYGAFTYHLCRELLAAQPDATYRDVFELSAPHVSQRFPHQHPQLEGMRDRHLFEVRVTTPDPYVSVEERSDDVATLAGGVAHGLTVGSRWNVFPPGSKHPPDTPRLGHLEVLEAAAVKARALVLEEVTPGVVTTGCRAVGSSPSGEFSRLPVAIEPPSGELGQEIEERLDLSITRRAPPTGADLLLAGLDASSLLEPCLENGREPSFRCFEVHLKGGPQNAHGAHWLAIGRIGEPIAPLRPVAQQGSVETLISDLENRARYLQILTLENPDLWNPLRGQVEFEVLRRPDRDNEWQEPRVLQAGDLSLEDGDHLNLRIRHRYREPLYFCVLNLCISGSIDSLYPQPGACEALATEHLLEVGTERGNEIEVLIPPEYPFAGDPYTATGTAYVKLFVSTQPTDFSQLAQRGPKLSRPETLPTRGTVTREAGRQEDGHWFSLTKSFSLGRRARA